MNEILYTINLVILVLGGAFGTLVTFSKPIRDKLFANKEAKAFERDEMRKRQDTDKCLLRHLIISCYYAHCKDCEIRQYEFESVSKSYNQYLELGGNSFVCKIFEEMQTWTIIR